MNAPLINRIAYFQKIGYEVQVKLRSKYVEPADLTFEQKATTRYVEKEKPVNRGFGRIVKIFYLLEE